MKHKLITTLLIFLSIAYQSNSQLKIEAGATFKTSSSVSVVLTDIDLENNGNFVQDTFSNVRFSGIQNSVIKGSISPTISNLEMMKLNNAILSLSNHVNISKAVVFLSGIIDLNGYNVMLDSSAIIAGENEANRFVGSKGGYIQISKYMNAPSMVNPGNIGATISSNASIGNVNIRRGHTVQSGTGLLSSISRYYTIATRSNTGLSVRVRLQYLDAEKNNLDENTFVMYRLATNGTSWNKFLQTTKNTTLNFVDKTGINSFSTFTIGGDSAIVISRTSNAIVNNSAFSRKLNVSIETTQAKLTVGPNPNKGNFFFQVNGMEQSTPALLYTLDGKLIGQYKINEGQRQQVSGLKPGVYLLKINGMEPYKVVVQ